MANYPRLLNLDSATEEKLKAYLDTELVNHDAERGEWIRRLMNYQRDYWAEPSLTQRTFPFKGASNIVIPLSAIAVEAVHARVMMTLFALKPFVSAKSRIGELTQAEHPLENWIDYFVLEHLKAESQLGSSILDTEKFGNGIAKSGYERLIKWATRPVGDSKVEEEYAVIIKDGPTIDPVALANYKMPFYCQDPQTAPWVGEEHSSSWYEVELYTNSGLFYPGTYEKLKNQFTQTAGSPSTSSEMLQAQEKLEKRVPVLPARLFWDEIWLAFDTDGSEKLREIQVLYCRATRMLLAVRYNWHKDLRRPHRKSVYFPLEHRWTGIGICKQNEQFQREITTGHRQRLDNATIANMRMFKVHKLSGYGPKEPVFPGKTWYLDDMTHVEAIQLGDVYASAFSNEQSSLIYSQQRTGANETMLGMPPVGTPGTATGDLMRVQEGRQKFDFVYRNIRSFVSDIISDVVINVAQFGTRTARYFDLVEGGHMVRDLLIEDNIMLLRDGILFEVAAAGQQRNRALDRQNWQTVAAILQQYYLGLMQLADVLQNPQLTSLIAQKGMLAATEALKQILESYDIRNIDRIAVSELEGLLRNGSNFASQGGGNQPPEGVDPAQRMAGLLAALTGAGGNGGAGTALVSGSR